MQTISRAFAVAVCAMTATACNRLSDAKLAGIWRAEDDTTINEIACRSDHTFTSWTSWKNDLTTPSVGIGAGEWRLQDHQLIVHLKKYVLVDTWADEDKEITFKILKSDNDALLIKNFDDNKTVTYKRLLPDHVLTPMKRAHLGLGHFARVSHPVEPDKALNPIPIRSFGAQAVVLQSHDIAHSVD